jgi:hypothetical protein
LFEHTYFRLDVNDFLAVPVQRDTRKGGLVYHRGLRAAILSTALVIACGGAARTSERPRRARSPAMARPRPPAALEVSAAIKRDGHTLRVDVTGFGNTRPPGEDFEDPTAWTVVARDGDGAELKRVVNGPAQLVREPVGEPDEDIWDVTVTFSLWFHLGKGVEAVTVDLEPPGGPAVSIEKAL